MESSARLVTVFLPNRQPWRCRSTARARQAWRLMAQRRRARDFPCSLKLAQPASRRAGQSRAALEGPRIKATSSARAWAVCAQFGHRPARPRPYQTVGRAPNRGSQRQNLAQPAPTARPCDMGKAKGLKADGQRQRSLRPELRSALRLRGRTAPCFEALSGERQV